MSPISDQAIANGAQDATEALSSLPFHQEYTGANCTRQLQELRSDPRTKARGREPRCHPGYGVSFQERWAFEYTVRRNATNLGTLRDDINDSELFSHQTVPADTV